MLVHTVAINILLRWSKEGFCLCVVSELLTDIVNRFLIELTYEKLTKR